MAIVKMYGDESSQNGHDFMVLGTIWDETNCCDAIEIDVARLKGERGFKNEFHWTDLKRHQLSVYQGLIDIFASYRSSDCFRFCALVVDQNDFAHQLYSDDDELHFYKMFFWLIYRRLDPSKSYGILLDRKTNSVEGRLSELKHTLNQKCIKDHSPFLRREIVRYVEPRDGSQIGLQIADVFSGAIAYVWNGHYAAAKMANPNTKNPKVKLVDYIQSTLGINLQSFHGPEESPNFNIWRFQRRISRHWSR
ncbi:DUF3800 domain-containing protein [Pseudalkalibacillus sp. JSM 102089]|uniref:DUF3800 domain-containing protein n=1 Tax=Pseudalkalibacillus sp. JSM 102089 TaxID=3229856 RepID=UPI003524F275